MQPHSYRTLSSSALGFTLHTVGITTMSDQKEAQCVTGQPHSYRTLSSLTFLFSKNCCVKSSISIFSAEEKSSKVNTIQNSCHVNGYFHQSFFKTKAQMYLKNTFPFPLASKSLSLSLCLTHTHLHAHTHSLRCTHMHSNTHTHTHVHACTCRHTHLK